MMKTAREWMLFAVGMTVLWAGVVSAAEVPWDQRPDVPGWWQADPLGVNPLSPEPQWAGTGLYDMVHSGHADDPPWEPTFTWEKRTQTTKPYEVFAELSVYGYWSPDSFMTSYPEFRGAYFGFCTDMENDYPASFDNPAWVWTELTWTGGDGGPDAIHRNAHFWGDVTLPELGETWLSGRLKVFYQPTENEQIEYDLHAQVWGVPEPMSLSLLSIPLAIGLARRRKR